MSDSDNVFDIGIGTGVDQSGVDKGLKDVEKKVKDSAKKQNKSIQDANKKNAESFKDFAKSAAQQLLGIDQLLMAMAGGPAALGKAVVDMGKKAVAAFNEMAEKWREQEKLEIVLQKAAQNNPYLNERSVRQLKEFANEMQKITGVDSDLVLESETKLARLGRTQKQIQQIIKTATDVAATGMMGYDEAIMELNGSLNGVIRTSGRLFPELKNLSQEALAAGEAIDLMAAKVNGAAAEAMQTGAGSVTAYQNAIADLKKTIGEGWEDATRPAREWITEIINKFLDAKNKSAELRAALERIRTGTADTADAIIKLDNITLQKLKDELEFAVERYNDIYFNRVTGELVESDFQRQELEAIEKLRQRIRQEEELLANLTRRLDLENALSVAVERAKNASSAADTLEAQTALNTAIRAQVDALRLWEQGLEEAARGQIQVAENAAKIAEQEVTRIQNENEAARFREENLKALDEELKKSIRNAEMRNEITKQEADRLRVVIDARKEGETLGVLETRNLGLQNQFLMANAQAYENLLVAAKEYIDGTDRAEKDRFENLKRAWAAYDERAERERAEREREKAIDEERKRRLAELARAHEETQARIVRIFEDIYSERDRLFDLQAEQDHQAQLEELIKKSLKRSIDFETQYRIEQAKAQQQKILDRLDEEHNKRMDQIRSMRETEMEQYAEGSAARLAVEAGLLEELDQLQLEYDRDREEYRVQLEENTAAQIVQIERDAAAAVTAAWQAAWNDALNAAQKYLNAASSIANSISAIWHNSIDYETDERLRANDKMVQSDEERAANEKKIMMESAYEKYKADMFIWSANIALATANAAMAVLNALSTQPWYAGLANSIIAGAMGAFQVAAVISAQPKPPRFHTGGIAQGAPGQEVPAILRAGEPVLTQDQFGNVMKAFANVANSRYGGGGTNLVVNVKNSAANMVNTEQKLSPEGLEIVITQIVKKNLSNGGLDEGLALQRSHSGGINITS